MCWQGGKSSGGSSLKNVYTEQLNKLQQRHQHECDLLEDLRLYSVISHSAVATANRTACKLEMFRWLLVLQISFCRLQSLGLSMISGSVLKREENAELREFFRVTDGLKCKGQSRKILQDGVKSV